jgi:hypothetical protein
MGTAQTCCFGDLAAPEGSCLPRLPVRLARDRLRGEHSDIDIGIEGPAPLSRGALAAIHDELKEAATLYTIDIVDLARISEKFLLVAEHWICAVTKARSLRADFDRQAYLLQGTAAAFRAASPGAPEITSLRSQ